MALVLLAPEVGAGVLAALIAARLLLGFLRWLLLGRVLYGWYMGFVPVRAA